MKTYEFKNELFNYFNGKIVEQYPELEGKIFRERLKIDKPSYPYVCLKSGIRTRLNNRFERFFSDGAEYIRVQYSLPITFSVHDIKAAPKAAEEFSDEVIDYIEMFFTSNPSTHMDLGNNGIVINEQICSGVRDISSFSKTAQEFVKEIDIAFEFENLVQITSEAGLDLETNIECS